MDARNTSVYVTRLAMLAGVVLAAGSLDASDEFREARKKAAHRARRVIVNNDGNDAQCVIPEKADPEKSADAGPSHVDAVMKPPYTPERFLQRRIAPLAGSHVDAIFYCDGYFNAYLHESDVTEMKPLRPDRHNLAAEFIEKYQKDPLRYVIQFGHDHGMEVFWSMRMNDTHDSNRSWNVLSNWKREHSELMMSPKYQKFPYGMRRWSALNYAEPEVREQALVILRDVASRYDVDGLELDFCRHPVYFKPQMTGEPVTQAQCDLITDLVGKVRQMADEVGRKRGRPLLVAVRVPDSTGYAKAIGLDFEAWLKQDFVDLLIVSDYLRLEPWRNSVELGKKYDVPVYACLSASRLGTGELSSQRGRADLELWRGEALNAWQSGIDGIYTFNCFDPYSPIFRELGDPAQLRSLPHRYERVVGAKVHLEDWLKGGEKFIVPEQ